MAHPDQMTAILYRTCEELSDTQAQILYLFDQEHEQPHECHGSCFCDPEVFIFETGHRSYRHKRDC